MALKIACGRVSPPTHPLRFFFFFFFARSGAFPRVPPSSSSIWSHCISCHGRARVHVTVFPPPPHLPHLVLFSLSPFFSLSLPPPPTPLAAASPASSPRHIASAALFFLRFFWGGIEDAANFRRSRSGKKNPNKTKQKR